MSNPPGKKSQPKTKNVQLKVAPKIAVVKQPGKVMQSAVAKPRVAQLGKNPLSKEVKSGEKKVASYFAHMHSKGTQVANSSLRDGSFSTTTNANGVECRGTERLQAISDSAADEAATLFGEYEFNPLSVGARLPIIAQNYTKFRFTKVRVCYVPQISPANTAANGTLVMAAQFDPEQPPPDAGDEGVDELYAYQNRSVAAVWQDQDLTIDLSLRSQEWLFVSDQAVDSRFLYQFNLGLYRGNYFTGSGNTLGQAYFDYTVEFSEPILNIPQPLSAACAMFQTSVTASSTGALLLTDGGLPIVATTAGYYGGLSFGSGTTGAGGQGNGFFGNKSFLTNMPGSTTAILIKPGLYRYELDVLAQNNTGAATWSNIPIVNLVDPLSRSTKTITNAIQANAGGTSSYFNGVNTGTTSNGSYWHSEGVLYIDNEQTTITCALGSTNQTGPILGTLSIAQVVDTEFLPGGPLAVAPSIMSAFLAAKNRAEGARRRIVRALRESATTAVSDELSIVAECFGLQMAPTSTVQPLIWPALAGILTWFATTYGPKLGQAALDWGLGKIKNMFAQKEEEKKKSKKKLVVPDDE